LQFNPLYANNYLSSKKLQTLNAALSDDPLPPKLRRRAIGLTAVATDD